MLILGLTSLCISDVDTICAWVDKRPPRESNNFIGIFLKALF